MGNRWVKGKRRREKRRRKNERKKRGDKSKQKKKKKKQKFLGRKLLHFVNDFGQLFLIVSKSFFTRKPSIWWAEKHKDKRRRGDAEGKESDYFA